MDPLTSIVFTVVTAAVAFYVLYWVVRRAVAGGIRDAASTADIAPGATTNDVPR
ncbi:MULTISPECIES: hypothetical protein [Tessaracoccus]|uniref:Uncharacterized protein n=2 Tax=Tessaracoccus TaxID=72763 RepID=A0ABY8Q155_9ACTN|nr:MULTISPECIES: hypothetical protein [Tessaracoccus]QXT61629.1 hypothetical protein KDB89_07330 [Tessaracoccus palaemonis]WGT48447.1 hypothetical protein QH948_06825 [Tessaracoccus sp. T21]